MAFDKCDLVPNVLNPVTNIDTSVEILGKKIDLPIFLSPTALQRLFHHEGERAVGEAAEEFNTYFGISSLATIGIEEIGKKFNCPKPIDEYLEHQYGNWKKPLISSNKEEYLNKDFYKSKESFFDIIYKFHDFLKNYFK